MKYELVEWFGIDLALHGCGFKSWGSSLGGLESRP